MSSYAELFTRYHDAAMRRARSFQCPSMSCDDLVSESFARVLDALRDGNGPRTAFRAYLLMTMRNVFYERDRRGDGRVFPTGDDSDLDSHTGFDADSISDQGVMQEAFGSLNTRWRTVLWQSQVQQLSYAEIAAQHGISATATTSLINRAREGLRQAYVQAHASAQQPDLCGPTVAMLGAWFRNSLKSADRAAVSEHLLACRHCRDLADELHEINTNLPAARAS
ncbi:MAG: sigma-70 family RNA polymerase sigma factor [Nakamurella sp.]